jgi:hypothetical protein
MQIEVTPALAMHAMFTEVVEMAQAGRMNRRGLPRNPFALASLARRYDNEAHAPMPRRLQRALLAPLTVWTEGPGSKRGGMATLQGA